MEDRHFEFTKEEGMEQQTLGWRAEDFFFFSFSQLASFLDGYGSNRNDQKWPGTLDSQFHQWTSWWGMVWISSFVSQSILSFGPSGLVKFPRICQSVFQLFIKDCHQPLRPGAVGRGENFRTVFSEEICENTRMNDLPLCQRDIVF